MFTFYFLEPDHLWSLMKFTVTFCATSMTRKMGDHTVYDYCECVCASSMIRKMGDHTVYNYYGSVCATSMTHTMGDHNVYDYYRECLRRGMLPLQPVRCRKESAR